jgi:hypothetical protein
VSAATPKPKVVAGGVAGALVTILVWVASLVELAVPTYVAAAVTVVFTAAAAYMWPDS